MPERVKVLLAGLQAEVWVVMSNTVQSVIPSHESTPAPGAPIFDW
ncbi:MAG: hypothetical protein ACP5O2_01165 [Bacteroidales bacterium]